MKIAAIIGGLVTQSSGVANVVCALANEFERLEQTSRIYTATCRGRPLVTNMLDHPETCVAEPGIAMGGLAWSPKLRRRIQMDFDTVDIVHNHSLWMLPNSYAAEEAQRRRIPLVYSIHGFLEPWALQNSRWKKRIAGRVFQDRQLHGAACLHANSIAELGSIRRYGLRNPVAIIPNGASIPAPPSSTGIAGEGDATVVTSGKKVILFLSRLHEKKGLDVLLEAWQHMKDVQSEWHLVIAGPDDGYGRIVRRQIDDLGLCKDVTLSDPVTGSDKMSLLQSADIFILPSYSEGFSVVLLEAMACSVPILYTKGCNFPEAMLHGAGVELEYPSVVAVETGLRQMVIMTDQERADMGEKAHALVQRNYRWDHIASTYLSLYRWLSEEGDQPECVENT